MVGLVGSIQERFKGWKWVFFEQSRPGFSRPPKTSEANWRASQSNILIHHFIKNGRILTEDEWREIIHDGGSVMDSVEESGYLDYKRYIVQL